MEELLNSALMHIFLREIPKRRLKLLFCTIAYKILIYYFYYYIFYLTIFIAENLLISYAIFKLSVAKTVTLSILHVS